MIESIALMIGMKHHTISMKKVDEVGLWSSKTKIALARNDGR